MPARYEFWLTNDAGRRLLLLNNFTFVSYSRSVSGYGTFEIGLPYKEFSEQIFPTFEPDRRVEAWRSPSDSISLRWEQTYLLRMPKIYTREDGVEIIVLYGRDLKDILTRRLITQGAGTPYTRKTDYADDMMKAIVREQMLFGNALDPLGVVDATRAYPTGEFMVQADQSLGPIVTNNFADRNVLDTLKDIREQTAQLALLSTADKKIYFDVVPVDLRSLVDQIMREYRNFGTLSIIAVEMGMTAYSQLSQIRNTEVGFRFVTFAGLRGMDRTNGVIFSQQNNNLKFPYYSKSWMDEINTAYVKGIGAGTGRAYTVIQDTSRLYASRWNRSEGYVNASSEPDQTLLANAGYSFLYQHRPSEQLSAVFLNVEGGPDSPRSLYGVDWDMGDLLPVRVAGKDFVVEVDIVYVAIDEGGRETITGRNTMNESEEV